MHQELQEEAKPKKNKMDQSIQKGIRKGVDSGELVVYRALSQCHGFVSVLLIQQTSSLSGQRFGV